MSATFADLFCGAGGSITGMVEAGFELVVGANHSERAIETVSSNYRDAEFLCTDINAYDMRRLPHTEVLWASVICTEISPAGGNRKLHGQRVLDLEEYGHIPSDSFERTRACALDVIRATEIHRYKAVVVENVVEFARDWELYDWWVEGMCKIRPGYNVQVVNVSAAHVYDEENDPAPQWRDRIYIVFTRKGIPLPDLELRPPSWCFGCDRLVEGRQTWKRPDRRQVGKYGQQYLFRCPNRQCGHSIVEPLVLPAISALDLSDVGQRIGDRKKPLAPKTMARIQWGITEFVEPIIATVAGNTYEAGDYKRAWPADGSPLPTRQATGCDAVACPPVMVNSHPVTNPLGAITSQDSHALMSVPFVIVNRENSRPHSVDEPLATVSTGNNQAVIQPFITMLRKHGTARSIEEPLATVAAAGNHHGLTTPPGAFVVRNYGGNAHPSHLSRPITEPLSPITTKDHHALVIPYRKGGHPRPAIGAPLPTISTKESAGLLQRLSIAVEDCFYRMLKPREHLRAQRIRDSYNVTGNIGEQTMQAGNAVPVNVAHWIGKRLAAVL